MTDEYEDYADELDALDAEYAETDPNAYAPEGWAFVQDSDGAPMSTEEGDYLLQDAEGRVVVWDPSTNEARETDVDLTQAAANAIDSLARDYPEAVEYLAAAEGIVDEDGNLIPDEDEPTDVARPEPSNDQEWLPAEARESSFTESLDQGLDEALAPETNTET
jgi:hypothetical protein